MDSVPAPADRGAGAEVAPGQHEVARVGAISRLLHAAAAERHVCVAVHVQQLEDVVVAVADGAGNEDLERTVNLLYKAYTIRQHLATNLVLLRVRSHHSDMSRCGETIHKGIGRIDGELCAHLKE